MSLPMYQCGAPSVTEHGAVVPCDHPSEIEGRFCTCCDFQAGIISDPRDAIMRLIAKDVLGMTEEMFGVPGQVTQSGYTEIEDGVMTGFIVIDSAQKEEK